MENAAKRDIRRENGRAYMDTYVWHDDAVDRVLRAITAKRVKSRITGLAAQVNLWNRRCSGFTDLYSAFS